jgi:hypothetical protein
MTGKSATTNCYDVTFSEACYNLHGDPEDFHVVMELNTQLPFVPVAGMVIGFEPHSTWGFDESEVAEVMWCVHQSRFLVRLKDGVGNARHAAQWRAERGWKIQMDVKFETRKEAEQAVEENELHSVVEHDGGFFAMSKPEAEMLQFIASKSSS